MTTSVGVRELKLHASRLVRRAAAGERIIVSRRGVAAAVLAPLDDVEGKAVHPSLAAWNRERRAFEQLAPARAKEYEGRYVVICGGVIIDSDNDYDKLRRRTLRKLRTRPFLIGRVAALLPVVDMPGFELG